MCGIIGYAGSDVSHFNRHKFNIIGIYNDKRGGDSCGVSFDGEIHKGINNLKLYRNFITVQDVQPMVHPTVIGHTRKSSVGAITKNNAHPFAFSDSEDGIDDTLIGCHNGTIHNYKELAEEYDIPLTYKEGAFTVYKTDSQILLQILAQNPEDYSVLEKYYGGASLLWYNPQEPNVIYAFRGESSKFNNTTAMVEERPLFYYKESKNSLYVSSLEDPLLAIGGDLQCIDEFEANTVYKITDGDIDNAELTTVDRTNVSQSAYYSSTQSSYASSDYISNRHEYYGNIFDDIDDDIPYVGNGTSKNKDLNIHSEKLNLDEYKGKIYFERLRFKRNGHLVSGVYTFVKGYGFVFLGTNYKAAEIAFNQNLDKYFDNGLFLNTKLKGSKEIPFPKKEYEQYKTKPLYGFIDGILMRSRLDYEQIKDNANLRVSMKNLSEASMYPITTHKKFKNSSRQRIFYNGKLFTGTISALGSKYIYKIANGNLIGKSNVNVNFKKAVDNKTHNHKDVRRELMQIICDDLKSEKIMKVKNDDKSNVDVAKSNELLLTAVNKHILPLYATIPVIMKEVAKYDESTHRAKIINSLNVISSKFEEIVKIIE